MHCSDHICTGKQHWSVITALCFAGTEIFDSTRMFSGIPLGNSVNAGSAFAPATFVAGASPGTPTAIVTQASLFPGQNVLTDGRQPNIDMNMTPFMPIFGTNVSKEIPRKVI